MKPRTLKQITREFTRAARPQFREFNRQLRNVGQFLAEDEAALEASKVQGFRDIETGANRRGLLFGGIPLAEQASYLATDFLPALTALRRGSQEERQTIRDAIAALRSGIGESALGVLESDRDRAFQARQNQLDRANRIATASIGASNSGSDSLSNAEFKRAAFSAFNQDLASNAGSDNYVSPDWYWAKRKEWLGGGLEGKEFDARFARDYINPNDSWFLEYIEDLSDLV